MKIFDVFWYFSAFWKFGILLVFCIFVLKFQRLSTQVSVSVLKASTSDAGLEQVVDPSFEYTKLEQFDSKLEQSENSQYA